MATDKAEQGEYKDITKAFVKFENPGDTVEGIFRGGDVIELKGKPTQRHFLETLAGDEVVFLGSSQLDAILIPELMGERIKITYTASAKTGGGFTVKQFTVGKWQPALSTPPKK